MGKSDFDSGYISAEKHLKEIGINSDRCEKLFEDEREVTYKKVIDLLVIDSKQEHKE